MIQFTGWQYLLIDLANAFGPTPEYPSGLDKELFEVRIQWATDNLDKLESLADTADSKPLYVKAMLAVRKAQKGIPSGHLVGFDASCSGIQIMSTLTGCKAGAEATGLIDPNKRADAYTDCTRMINEILGSSAVTVGRKKAKSALMTSFYGSTAQPIRIFGEDTPELAAFYQAAQVIAPGAWELLQDLLNSWQSGALSHDWTLPDGFEAKVKVMLNYSTLHEGDMCRIEVDELDHASFSYDFKINQGVPIGHFKAKSNAANVVHSVDAYVLRSIHRRCNYNRELVEAAYLLILNELADREAGVLAAPENLDAAGVYYTDLYERSGMADVVVLPYITEATVNGYSTKHLQKLRDIIGTMLCHKPFEVVTIHDEFKCHANNMNHLRQHYINIFCEMADATILDMIFTEIMGADVKYKKLSSDLSKYIAGSNYSLC